MKNTYNVFLMNDQGAIFDDGEFTNLKKARKWAAGRGGNYDVRIYKNGSEEIFLVYTPRQ